MLTRDLADIPQRSAPTEVWIIADGTGAPVDLSAKSLRVVVWKVTDAGDEEDPTDDTIIPAWKYESGGGGLTVGGTDNNQVTLQHDSAKNATPGRYGYALWNVTNKIVLAKGCLRIDPAAFDV
jgi:hypothetical protein